MHVKIDKNDVLIFLLILWCFVLKTCENCLIQAPISWSMFVVYYHMIVWGFSYCLHVLLLHVCGFCIIAWLTSYVCEWNAKYAQNASWFLTWICSCPSHIIECDKTFSKLAWYEDYRAYTWLDVMVNFRCILLLLG